MCQIQLVRSANTELKALKDLLDFYFIHPQKYEECLELKLY